MKTNNLTGKIVVKTGKGSIRVREFLAGGDWAVIGVRGDRVLTYSFRSVPKSVTFLGQIPSFRSRATSLPLLRQTATFKSMTWHRLL